ncbi:MAG: ABC transporter permease [Actinomycetota bacterium]|nr:ABC transporter permease [Actinomycetota bacterium]
MLRYIIRRLLFSIPVLLVASVGVYAVVRWAVDPLAAFGKNPRLSPKDIAGIREAMGLNQSGVHQYLTWLSHFVRFNWGTSIVSQQPVWPDIRTALFNSAILGLTGVALSLVIGVAIGVYSSIRQYSAFDNIATTTAFVGISIPNFWFALMLQLIFGVYLTRWFHLGHAFLPVAGMISPGADHIAIVDLARHLILPVTVLAVQIVAVYSRYMRASMLEVLHSDYLRTARAKGLRERRVIFRHAMRNALIPVTTQLAIDIGTIAAGLIITEQIFSWPGMGPYFIDAIQNGDTAQVLPWMMITVFSVIVFNLIADLSYAILDPRIHYA